MDFMRQIEILIFCAAWCVTNAPAAEGAVVYSASSSAVPVDSRQGVVPMASSVTLPYDSTWIGGSPSAAVSITDNGMEVFRGIGKGEFALPLSGLRRHELVYSTYVNGIANSETYVATFAAFDGIFGHDGDALSKVADDLTVDGGTSVKLSAADSSESWVDASVTNGFRISFDWKSSCEPLVKGTPYDYIEFSVDGVSRGVICGETDWTNSVFCVFGDGEHRLRWAFRRDSEGAFGEDCAWVANIVVTPEVVLTFSPEGTETGEPPDPIVTYVGDTVSIPGPGALEAAGAFFLCWDDNEDMYREGESYTVGTNDVGFTARWTGKTFGDYLGCPSRTFTTWGDAAWSREPVADGEALILRSGSVTHSQTSTVETVVYGSGTVVFSCKVEGEVTKGTVYDGLKFCVDGEQCGEMIGEGQWTNVTITVTDDCRHVLSWRYGKDGDGDGEGEDCAWLDTVAWKPDAALPPIDGHATEADVSAIISEFADEKLRQEIDSAEMYSLFRSWAINSNIDMSALTESPYAWLSFAIGASRLLESEPAICFVGVSADVLGDLHKSLCASAVIKDSDVAVSADAEKVKRYIEASCDLHSWNQEVLVEVVDAVDGETAGAVMRFRVTPVSSDGEQQDVDRLFLRIRIPGGL